WTAAPCAEGTSTAAPTAAAAGPAGPRTTAARTAVTARTDRTAALNRPGRAATPRPSRLTTDSPTASGWVGRPRRPRSWPPDSPRRATAGRRDEGRTADRSSLRADARAVRARWAP